MTSRTLNEREQNILSEMAEGLTNAAIAKRLFVSENTIKAQVKQVFDKLSVDTRAQAVAVGFRQGWLK